MEPSPCNSHAGARSNSHGQQKVSPNFAWIFFKCTSGKLHSIVDLNQFYALKCPLLNVYLNKFWQICTFVQPQVQSRYKIFWCCKKFPNIPSPRKPSQALTPGKHWSAFHDYSNIVSIHSSLMVSEVGHRFKCLRTLLLFPSFMSAPFLSSVLLVLLCVFWSL